MSKLFYKQGNHLIVKSSTVSVDDVFYIGRYPWRVLWKDKTKALLISDDVIDTRSMHRKNENTSYENSDLARWFLTGFPSFALPWDFLPLIDKERWIFILSKAEVEMFFPEKLQRVINNQRKKMDAWWLRDTNGDKKAYYVSFTGQISEYPDYKWEIKGIRPAFYLALDISIDIGNRWEDYRETCQSFDAITPYVGMLEEDIEKTKCGVFYDALLFSNSHCYMWKNENNELAMTVQCEEGKVISVNKLSHRTCWNEEEEPTFVGIAHKVLENL